MLGFEICTLGSIAGPWLFVLEAFGFKWHAWPLPLRPMAGAQPARVGVPCRQPKDLLPQIAAHLEAS